ncbi:DNA helicase MCM8 isoform X1 [Dunckerocampus dactyliophorus]|uniref:DNA helicase MCM8 isoform X1 n=2 Tax=Dunckerocampus dactyliophorus TaxID=161453 RepID=UPI0024052852|nr:DNA helicase MCM8 isoform X1 [Dunckerocampus dactyliophorus]XP_054655186.1 DNA helicase MCM8 isoform X1 [Dunckerocampus dactyliophorus]
MVSRYRNNFYPKKANALNRMSGENSRRASWRGGIGGWRGGGGGWRGGRGGWRGGGVWRGGGAWRGRGGGDHRGSGSHSSSTQRILHQATLDVLCPYKGWPLYFADGFIDSSPSVEKIKVFEKYFTSKIHLYDKDEIERQGSVLVDYADLTTNEVVHDALPTLTTELKQQPEMILNCLGVAIHQVLTVDLEKQAAELQGEELPVATPIINIPHISARLYNYESLTPLRTLRASVFGQLVCVKGTVVRVSNIRPLCTRLAFRCMMCSHTLSLPLQRGKYTTPSKCNQSDCRSHSFSALRSSPLTQTVDWQLIKVQELMCGEQREAGRIPRTVECHLTSDLCDSCVPGDTVTVTGIVRVTNDGTSRRNQDQCMFLLYIEATSVSNTKGQQSKSGGPGSRGSHEDRSGGEEFSLKELYAIQEIQSQPDLLRLIVHSLCPAIYGHLLVKAALVLVLFGGRQKHTDKNSVPVRGDPHVLMVGDPGLGKSQMLQAVCNVAPRGIYVCGNSASTAGLTVSLYRDPGSGDYALEAGALVLADQGLCCIDEFDKLGNQQQALLEAMEQQTVSLAKAGIVSSLPARTSVVAAANPVRGHYNRGKSVSENLKMGSPLLSRFDVIFLLLDIPDEAHDRLLSEHVMANRAGKGKTSSTIVTRNNTNTETSILLEHSDMPLSDRLKIPAGETSDPIPACLLRKYISYARHYVHPVLSPEAAQTLQDFYLSLRSQSLSADCTPITTRQLESLIRLTEARARLDLRETATKSDAEDVVEIMKHSLVDTYSDGLGNLDFERSQLGAGMSQRSAAKRLVNALHTHAQQTNQKQFDLQTIRSVALRLNIKVMDFDGLVSSLNEQGFLLKKGAKLYQLQTV